VEGRQSVTLVDERTAARVAALIESLVSRGQTVAVAESITGGLLCSTLVNPAGASRAVLGGVVAYSSEIKRDVLGVDGALLADRGAVNAEVALAMARGVRERLGANIGIATTGVAGPDSQDGISRGTAFIAIDLGNDSHSVVEKVTIPGTRDDVRFGVVLVALELLENSLRAE
jgi:nicotinamide-nucleotide amidase